MKVFLAVTAVTYLVSAPSLVKGEEGTHISTVSDCRSFPSKADEVSCLETAYSLAMREHDRQAEAASGRAEASLKASGKSPSQISDAKFKLSVSNFDWLKQRDIDCTKTAARTEARGDGHERLRCLLRMTQGRIDVLKMFYASRPSIAKPPNPQSAFK